jgi:hypothetical protein
MEWLTLRWPDAGWHLIPGLLIYQLLGTIRHELAHAIAYALCGWKVTEVLLLPHWYRNKFYWGRYTAEVQGGAKQSIHLHLAPYEACALALGIWFAVARWLPPPWVADERLAWNLWAAFTALFLISPIIDTLYNLLKLVLWKRGDFWRAMTYMDRY